MKSFKFIYLFKNPISECNHILRYWRLDTQHTNFGGTQISSQQCIIILNVCVPNNRASKYMKKKINALKGEQADL